MAGVHRWLLPLIAMLVAWVPASRAQDMGWIRAQAIRDNVVSLRSAYGFGFGFIVGERDEVLYIVTANHVVRGPEDGGPHDRANVELSFFTEQGSTYSAVLQDTWLSSKKEDLAVVTITRPPRFEWRHEGFARLRNEVEDTPVWFVGRDGGWEVPSEPGRIVSKSPKGAIGVRGFGDAAVGGMSGGVIVSEYGVEGMIQSIAETGELRALSLGAIENFMKAWGHPWGIGGIEKRFTSHEQKAARGRELVVGANEVLTIGRGEAELIVERFAMENGSLIRFEEGVRRWSLTALTASFGRNVGIDGRGRNGADGADGRDGHHGDDCADGGDGSDGRDARDGTDGVDIHLKLGIRKIGSFAIDLSGGAGGQGGDGGDGGRGGHNYSGDCTTGDGGHGANGGNGGRGGDGGVLVLDYFFLDEPERTIEDGELRVFSNPGERGLQGSPGSRGSAGTNHRGSGGEGRDGEMGSFGRPGQDGRPGEFTSRRM